MDVLCTFKIKIESQNSDHRPIKDQWPYLNQDQDAKPQSGTSRILQSPKWGLKEHGCSLHLQNQDSEPKFGSVTISKSRSRCQTQVRILQCPPNPQIRAETTSIIFAPRNQNIEPEFGSYVYEGPVAISKSRSRCKPPFRNLQHPPQPGMRTSRTWMFFATSKSR